MSRKGKIVHEAGVIARQNFEGSFNHQAKLREIFGQFALFLSNLDLLPRRVKEVQMWTIHLYAQYLLAFGISDATVHNRVSALRMLLARAGRDVSMISSSEIGLPRRDRTGKKVPLTQEELDDLFDRARRMDEGFMYLLKLKWLFGLRSLESMRCAADLNEWLQALESGDIFVSARRGCKGGRQRNISVLLRWRDETIATLRQAEMYSREHDGRLIVGRRNNQEGSLNRLKRLYQRIGLTGEKSSQALRYSYACANAIERLSRGEDELHALGEIAEDLGHGAKTRKRFTLTTYLNPVAHLFENVFKNDRLVSQRADGVSPNSASQAGSEWYVPRAVKASKRTKIQRRRSTTLSRSTRRK